MESQSKPMPAVEPNQGAYVLDRGVAASVRLNLQHYMWKDHVGYLLHPCIPVDKEDLKVAEIATGTGIWLLELAKSLPPTAQLHGFDIDVTPYPPEEWLPSNVKLQQLDAFKDVPEHLVEQYDVLHVRLMMFVIKDNDIASVLRNLMRMLKPGGFLQWGEYDISRHKIVSARPSNSTENLVALQKFGAGLLKAPSWTIELENIFQLNGLLEVKAEYHPTIPSYYSYQQDINLMTFDELTRAYFDRLGKEEGQRGRDLLAKTIEESRKGVTAATTRITVVGRKALQ